MDITKGQAKAELGITTDAELARLLGITKQAVGRFGSDDDTLPKGRQWQLMARWPELFGNSPSKGTRKKAA